MQGSDHVIRILQSKGVSILFGYPGGAVLPLYESLRSSDIRHVLVRNEQSAVHMASGYARTTGKIGVCIGTSGPGATNLITGIATAHADSVPLLIITGQVPRSSIGRDVFQEADIVGATEPFTKHNYLVRTIEDLPAVIEEAIHIATTGRPGPVLVDIPVDVQQEVCSVASPTLDIPGYRPVTKPNKRQLKRAAEAIETATSPLLCVGGGIFCSGSRKSLRAFVQKTEIPLVHTMMGKGALPDDHPLYLGMIGSHGHISAKKAIELSDLIIIVGTRISNRATASNQLDHSGKRIVHIDIDPAEVGKNLNAHIPVVGDARIVLNELTRLVTNTTTTGSWKQTVQSLRAYITPPRLDEASFHPVNILARASSDMDDHAIFVADVGQNQIWTARHGEMTGNRRFLTSGGLGTMGYGLPAAIGAKCGRPDRQVVCVTGDGGLQMLLAELGTAMDIGHPVIILLMNNRRLGMVRELQDQRYGPGNHHGISFQTSPDFSTIAAGFGLNSYRVDKMEAFSTALKKALAAQSSTLIECMIDPSTATLWEGVNGA